MKKMIPFMMALMLVVSASAEWLMPLDCDKLFSEQEMEYRSNFQEYADICVYGTGYKDGSVKVSLENSDDEFSADFSVKNGVLSSIAGGVKQLLEGVSAGVYRMIVSVGERKIQYSEDIVVEGSGAGDGEAEVPEFTTIAAGLALIGAGIYIQKKRSRK